MIETCQRASVARRRLLRSRIGGVPRLDLSEDPRHHLLRPRSGGEGVLGPQRVGDLLLRSVVSAHVWGQPLKGVDHRLPSIARGVRVLDRPKLVVGGRHRWIGIGDAREVVSSLVVSGHELLGPIVSVGHVHIGRRKCIGCIISIRNEPNNRGFGGDIHSPLEMKRWAEVHRVPKPARHVLIACGWMCMRVHARVNRLAGWVRVKLARVIHLGLIVPGLVCVGVTRGIQLRHIAIDIVSATDMLSAIGQQATAGKGREWVREEDGIDG